MDNKKLKITKEAHKVKYEYLKDKIIEANPDFVNLQWDHFDLYVSKVTYSEESSHEETTEQDKPTMIIELKLKEDKNVKLYYRNAELTYIFKKNIKLINNN